MDWIFFEILSAAMALATISASSAAKLQEPLAMVEPQGMSQSWPYVCRWTLVCMLGPNATAACWMTFVSGSDPGAGPR